MIDQHSKERIFEAIEREVNDAIKQAADDGYARGKRDAMREMLAKLGIDEGVVADVSADLADDGANVTTFTSETARSESEVSEPAQKVRQRAPRGIVKELVTRVLGSSDQPMTPDDILSHAEGEMEQMVKIASVRSELRKGREEARYKEKFGSWRLTADHEVNPELDVHNGADPTFDTNNLRRDRQ